MSIPFDDKLISEAKKSAAIKNLETASIRQIKKLGDFIEEKTNEKILRMEMGIPGLPPVKEGIIGQVKSLTGYQGNDIEEKKLGEILNPRESVAKTYPDIYGIEPLKKEMSRFIKNFLNLKIEPDYCIPTVGSMMGAFVVFLTMSKLYEKKNKILFIDPGFPVQKQQCEILGIPYETFDVYEFRGEKLKKKLDSILKNGNFVGIIYSSPNNPTWITFTEEELKIIGEMANQYNVIVIEDLAYFGMDFRKDYSKPGEEPYQPTVANYTENFILLISSSKVFSYAGERVAMLTISEKVWNTESDDLKRYYRNFDKFGNALVYGTLYAVSSGVSHSTQYALYYLLKSVNEGKHNFVEGVREYGKRAKKMKELFTKYGFQIVYDKDGDEPIADGFYFTLTYPGMNTGKLLEELIRYGITAISLKITGSEREGIRACTSLIGLDKMETLEERLKLFSENNPIV